MDLFNQYKLAEGRSLLRGIDAVYSVHDFS